MALKLLFFAAKSQSPSGWGFHFQTLVHSHFIFSDYAPSVTRLSCINFLSTWPILDNFDAKKKFIFCLPLFAKAWLHSLLLIDFQTILGSRKNELTNAAEFMGLFFLDMNKEFLKLRIICSLQDLKISFHMQKFSLF